MKEWYMVTLVGRDQTGIVARVAEVLDQNACYLGEASMTRLGDRFAMMLALRFAGDPHHLYDSLEPVAEALSLHVHIDELAGFGHSHVIPDVRITVSGADRCGIVAEVTKALAAAGLNILDLQSEVAGRKEAPIYIMHIEGQALQGLDPLRRTVADLSTKVDIRLSETEPLYA